MADSRSQENLKQKSELIREGKPARYRLLTTRSDLHKSGKIRKWTFGQRGVKTQNKIILLVGETGTGKTTLINAIVNYTLGVKFEDHVWFEVTEAAQNQTEDQTKSQTTEITVYEVFTQDNPISVTIIDTPGYGDTRGAKHDEKIADNLLKLFKNDTGVKEIDAVCLVVKASQNRLSDRQHYIFDAVLSLFGKDIEENIVIFVTHSNGRHPKNAISAIKKVNVPCKKTNGTDPVFFLFDNCQAEEQTEEEEEDLKPWKLTEKSLNKFFASLEDQNRKSLEKTESVLTEQIQLKACLSNLRERIKLKERKQDQLTQIQEALKENQEKIQKNENFSFTVTRSYKEKVTIENASWWDRKTTCCSVCEENCHESCWCAINPGWCKVMKDGHCTACTGKCHHREHIRENKKYVIKSEVDTMTYTDVKKQYKRAEESAAEISLDSDKFENVKKEIESNTKQTEEKMSIENILKAELMELEKEKIRLVEQACNSIMKLSEITLKPDSAFIVETLNFLIPRAEEAEHPEWVEKLKKLREIDPEAEARVEAAMRYFKAGYDRFTSFVGFK